MTWEQLEPIVCELNANAPNNRRCRKLKRPLVSPVDTPQGDCPLPSKKPKILPLEEQSSENSHCSSDEKILSLNIVPSDTNSKGMVASPLVTLTDDHLSPPKVATHTSPHSPPENNTCSYDTVKTTRSPGESTDPVWNLIKLLQSEMNHTASIAPNIEATNSVLQSKEGKNEGFEMVNPHSIKRKKLRSPTIDDDCLLAQDHVTDSGCIEVLSTSNSLLSSDRPLSVVEQTDQVYKSGEKFPIDLLVSPSATKNDDKEIKMEDDGKHFDDHALTPLPTKDKKLAYITSSLASSADAEYLQGNAPMQQNARRRCEYEFVCETNGLNCYNKKTMNIHKDELPIKLAYAFPDVDVKTLPDRYPCLVTLGIGNGRALEKETFEVFGASKLRDAIQAVLINHTCGNKKTNDVYVVKASSSKDTNVASTFQLMIARRKTK